MADFPALPLWVSSYVLDAGHLSDAEHGRYLLLLILTWTTPECRIPNDNAWIARRMKRSVEDVERDVRPILDEFFSTSGNWLFQKRLKREWEYLRTQKKKKSAAAKARWEKEKASTDACATDTPSADALTLTPTPKEEKKERKKKASAKSKMTLAFTMPSTFQEIGNKKGFTDDRIESIFEEWREYWTVRPNIMRTDRGWADCWRNWLDLKAGDAVAASASNTGAPQSGGKAGGKRSDPTSHVEVLGRLYDRAGIE